VPSGTTRVSFEDSIRRLSEIVETLEGGELPLEESLRLFEEGIKLARTSQGVLDRAEKRVEELLSVDEHGNPVVREIDME
jgi:exodeoxyribonuclease VII small subunit